MTAMGNYWIGIDTGGTFTDLVLRNTSDAECVYHKIPTRTSDPAQGILDGIRELISLGRIKPQDVDFVVLGTTLATNAVLERTWARAGMLTTAGFGDVLDIARQRRPHYFNLDIPKPAPPSARTDRYEINGRLLYNGNEESPLDEAAIRQAIGKLKAGGVEAIAVCFMHSYANDEHEQRALALVRELWPAAYVCASADVLPEFREYERFATAAVNASLMPVMDRYLERFELGVKEIGVARPARVMQSNGGAVTAATVRRLPINTFFSGPAGGVMATISTGHDIGHARLITFDMGGTSTDVCLVKDHRPPMKSERPMGGLPVRAPTLDIHTIGAGGGSLAWIDAGGMLKVGPKSAGAYPGPAAYGRGGTLPTVTDANVLLGRLNPVSLLDGRMDIFPDNASAAIREAVATPLGFDVVDAAVGILQIANVHMTEAVRVISIEQGEDPREYALVAFGGAGPLHAVDVALSAGIQRVIVPPRPGLFSAQGLLQSDQRGDFSMTRLAPAQGDHLKSINTGFEELGRRIDAWLADENADGDAEIRRVWQIDLRYAGQSSDLTLPLEVPRLDESTLEALRRRFHERHKELFGYEMSLHDVEIVNVRASVFVEKEKPIPAESHAQGTLEHAIAGRRPVWFAGVGFTDTPIIKRDRLYGSLAFQGPAVIEQMDATTVVPPDAGVRVDKFGYLHIDLAPILDGQGAPA